MNRILRRLALSALVTIAISNAASVGVTTCGAQAPLTSPVTIEKLSDFRPILSADPRVVILLVPLKGSFPTFNVIRQPGSLGFHQDRLADETIASYQQSGFGDVRLITTPSIHQSPGQEQWEVMELTYRFSGTDYTAQVGYLGVLGEHLIATMIGPTADVAADRIKWRQLLNNMRVNLPVAEVAPRSNIPIYVGIAASLILGSAVLFVFRCKMGREHP